MVGRKAIVVEKQQIDNHPLIAMPKFPTTVLHNMARVAASVGRRHRVDSHTTSNVGIIMIYGVRIAIINNEEVVITVY